MRGIVSAAGYVPYNRLQRARITEVVGSGGGRGARSVASYDEDTTTMGFEAGRLALASAPQDVTVESLWFATAEPAYAEKTNASAMAAALRLDSSTAALDMCGAPRCGPGALRAALEGAGTTLVVSAGVRTGLPSGPDESGGGDGAAAVLVGDGDVVAEYRGGASVTEEFLDRWRAPGEAASHQWEERFGEARYVPVGEQAWTNALKAAGVSAADVGRVVVTGVHPRAVKSLVRRLGVDPSAVAPDLSDTVGNTGAAHAALCLTAVLEDAGAGQVVAVVNLADGADVVVLRTTDRIGAWSPARSVEAQVAAGDDSLAYAKFLSWRGMLDVQPPNRPEPARYSAPAAARNEDWKFGFVGSRDRASGALHLPPQRVSWKGGAVDDMDPAPMAATPATIVTFTVDRLAYSPSPPVVFAVCDFDGGGRLPLELTDVDPATVAIGDRVELTFRRLTTSADGVHNYFWKARPLPGGGEDS